MNRREFLRVLGLAAAVPVVAQALGPMLDFDPERALWVPGAKRIFDFGTPPYDTQLTISMITRDALRVLQNSLNVAQLMNREYDLEYDQAFVGQTVRVKTPPRFFTPLDPDTRKKVFVYEVGEP